MVRPSERMFRAAVIVAWSIVAVEELVSLHETIDPMSLAILSWRLLPLALFLPAVLRLIGQRSQTRPTHSTYALLALASVAGTIFEVELFYVVAAVLPFVLPPRRALAWLFACNVISVPWLVVVIARHKNDAGLDPAWSVGATLLVALFTHLGWQAFAFAIGSIAAAERDRHLQTKRLNRELVATQGLLADGVRLADRLEISRELHDTLGHHLTALHLKLELAIRVRPDQVRRILEEAQQVAKLLLADVRDAASVLRTNAMIDLRGALGLLTTGSGDTEVKLVFDAELRVTQAEHAHALFRCAQEAITNALRHASARVVTIDVRETTGGVSLSVRDDGRGTDTIAIGNGLRGMRERIESLDGRLAIDSRVGAGFCVEAWLPTADAA